MDLNRILHFITIAECGSYTKAAQKLGVPKSSLSKSLATLEETMQVRLLNRSTRKLSLTFAGEQFFKSSLPLINQLQNAHSEVLELNEKIKGSLKITMPYEFGSYFLSYFMPEFMETYPDIRFDIDFSYENKDLIEEGFDLAVRVGELDDSTYVAKKILTSTIGFYATKKYIQTHGTPHTLAELNQHQRVMPTNYANFIHAEQRQDYSQVKPNLISNSILFNKRICMAGIGIAGVADVFCIDELESGQLVKVLLNERLKTVNLYLVYPSRSHPSKALKVFNEFILNKANDPRFF